MTVESIQPLSPSQLGMLCETLAAARPGIHVEQSVFVLSGELDVARFIDAWQAVIARHAILRTAFVWRGRPEPLQVVLPRVRVPVVAHDWRAQPAAEQCARFAALLDDDRRAGFAPERAPLLRIALVRTADRTHRFVLTFHHILMDGWSLSIVLAEALASYEAARLPPAPPYHAYLRWQRAQDAAASEAHWRAALAGVTAPTRWGVADDDAPTGDGYDEHELRLPAAVGDGLRALAAAHRVTPSTVFQAAWGVLLAGYSGARDVVFGTTVSGRPPTLDGALAMVGLFINTVPLRLRLPDDDRLGPWLAAIQLAAAAGRAFEHAASGQIQRWSALPPGAPLYETVVVYENYPEDRSRLAGASLDIDLDRARTIGAQTAYPVTLLIGERAGWSLKLITRRDRICAPEAAGLVAEFEALLARLAGDPARPLTEQLAAIARPPRIAPTAGRARPSQPPRDAVELQLAAIWRDVLGGAAPGVHDSFFELGGHSLLALELVRRIERELGVSLALAALLERPTIEGVAEAIRGAAAVALAPAIYLGGAARPRAPVPAAVFCVPGAAMDTISLHPIARAVGDAVPIYGLQPRGLDGAQPPWRTIEDTAAAHVAAIRAIQPAGPYRIAGHSYGAHVAYEIAQQLRAAGCEVAWLAVLDARARTTRDAGVVTARDDEARLGRLVSLVRRFVGRDLALPLDELRPLGPEQRIERVAAALAGAGVLPVELGVRRLGHYLRVGEATAAAFEGYLAGGRHPVRTLVIRARERHADDDVLATAGDDTLGWGALAAGDASVHWVAGDHVTMITGDHAGEVAAVLRGALVGRAEAA